jgi:hypothetical protein
MDEPNILIKTALDEAVQKVNAGMTPTEALKKVASDLDLNPNYIQRTGEALNVALHYNHFKTASDRSDEFEIADIPKAIQDSFTFNEKTAAEAIAEQFSVSDANETIFNYNRMLSNPVYKRAFLEVIGATETEEYFPTTFDKVYEKSANYIQKLNKAAEEAEVGKTAAEIELNSCFSSLAQEFRKEAAARVAFEEFESQVFSKHGSTALPYLDLIHKTACPNEDRGVHDAGYIMFDQSKQAMLFDKLMDAAKEFITSEKQAAEIKENLDFESAYLKDTLKALGKNAGAKKEDSLHEKSETAEEEKQEHIEGDEDKDEDPVMQEVKKKASNSEYTVGEKYAQDPVLEEALQKEAFAGLGGFGGLGGFVQGIVEPHVTEAFGDSFKRGTPPDIKPPNQTLDNMERKLLLQELMMTDPILSKINPAKVARAYEQLLRLSPEISKEKEVVRAELRAMVSSQALSKFDADLFAKTDASMLKRRIGTSLFNKGNAKSFRL